MTIDVVEVDRSSVDVLVGRTRGEGGIRNVANMAKHRLVMLKSKALCWESVARMNSMLDTARNGGNRGVTYFNVKHCNGL